MQTTKSTPSAIACAPGPCERLRDRDRRRRRARCRAGVRSRPSVFPRLSALLPGFDLEVETRSPADRPVRPRCAVRSARRAARSASAPAAGRPAATGRDDEGRRGAARNRRAARAGGASRAAVPVELGGLEIDLLERRAAARRLCAARSKSPGLARQPERGSAGPSRAARHRSSRRRGRQEHTGRRRTRRFAEGS